MSALFLLLVPIALYFLVMRPQRQRVAAQRRLLTSLSPGDRVITHGGMIGTLRSMDADRATVELAPNVVIEFLAPAIARRLEEPARLEEPDRPEADRAAEDHPAGQGRAAADARRDETPLAGRLHPDDERRRDVGDPPR